MKENNPTYEELKEKCKQLEKQVNTLKSHEKKRENLEEILATISSRFVSAFDVDESINASLADMGKLNGSSRAYLFLFSKDGELMSNTHEWCAKGVTPEIDNLQNLPCNELPWLMDKLRKGETIHIKDVSNMPEEAKAEKKIFEAQNIKSLLVLPVYIENELKGFIGFDNVSKTGDWHKSDIKLLQISSQIIVNALKRKRAEKQLRLTQFSLDNATPAVFWLTPEGNFTYVNNTTCDHLGYRKKEVERMNVADIDPNYPAKKRKEQWKKIKKGQSLKFESVHKKKDGTLVPVKIISHYLNFEGEEYEFAFVQDITEWKNKEADLKKYKEILDELPDPVMFKNTEGKYQIVNDAVTHYVGYSREEIIGKRDRELFGEQIGKEMWKEEKQALKKEEIISYEESLPTEKGEQFFKTTRIPFYDIEGNILGITSICRDISELKKREKELLKTYHAIENSVVCLAFLDMEGNIEYVNPEILRTFGYEEKEVINRHMSEFAEDKKEARNILQKIRKEEVWTGERIVRNKQGNNLNILGYGSLIKNKENIPLGLQITVIDITERKQTEEALRKSEKQYAFLTNAANELVNLTSIHAVYEYTARKLYELLEGKGIVTVVEFMTDTNRWKMQHVEGIKNSYTKLSNVFGTDIMQLEGDIHTKFYDKITSGKLVELDFDIPAFFNNKLSEKVGQTVKNILSIDKIYCIAFQQSENIYGNVSIITNKRTKPLNTELIEAFIFQVTNFVKKQKSEERLKENDRLKSAFLANMSHEIRTPMNGIIGFSQMLKEKEYPKEKRDKFLSIIHSRTNHLLNIINDLVDVSKIEANQLKLNFQDFCLNDVMKELYSIYNNQLQSKEKTHVQLKANHSLDNQNSYIYSDPSRFRQIMDNLINNAIKFTSEGRVEFGYKLKDEDTLLFYVQDTGTGIPREQQKHIFERFRQAVEPNSPMHEGTGLGLTISKNLVELLGGQMWVESEEGEGSVFYFTLPYATRQKTKNNEIKEEESNQAEGEGKTLLIIEDDPTSLEYIKELLEPSGFKVLTCKTGDEGYEAFLNHPEIYLILMDIKLPDINGLELTQKIRSSAHRNDVPIIAQTAYAMSEDAQKSLDAGCDDYISKPIDSEKLLKKISKFL
ncbi:MAG: PAS domain S-box protein [Bacteroidales bacterium]|nr:PAS domain S-box protein [Bacteroidales bacterium]